MGKHRLHTADRVVECILHMQEHKKEAISTLTIDGCRCVPLYVVHEANLSIHLGCWTAGQRAPPQLGDQAPHWYLIGVKACTSSSAESRMLDMLSYCSFARADCKAASTAGFTMPEPVDRNTGTGTSFLGRCQTGFAGHGAELRRDRTRLEGLGTCYSAHSVFGLAV